MNKKFYCEILKSLLKHYIIGIYQKVFHTPNYLNIKYLIKAKINNCDFMQQNQKNNKYAFKRQINHFAKKNLFKYSRASLKSKTIQCFLFKKFNFIFKCKLYSNMLKSYVLSYLRQLNKN